MAGKGQLSNTNEELLRMLECPVCYETFEVDNKPPIAFDCQHPLCFQCVSKIQVEGKITCPTCQDTSELKSQDVSKMPKDIARLSLMDILSKNKRETNTVRQCTVCDEGEGAVFYCEACKEYLCNVCAASHRRMKATKNHELVNARRNTHVETSVESSITVITCEQAGHEKQELINFCMICEVLICDKCGKTDHAGHNVQPSGNVYSAKSEEISEMLDALRQKEASVLWDRVEKATKTVIDVQANLTSDINRQFQMYQDILSERKTELLKAVGQWCQGRTKLLNKAKNQVDELKRQVSAAETVVRENDRVGFLKQFNVLKRDLEREMDRDIHVSDMASLTYSQVCPTDDFAKIVTALGAVQEGQILTSEATASKEAVSDPQTSQETAEHSGDFRCDTTCSPLMEVLKSLSFHSGSLRITQQGATSSEGSKLSLPAPTSIGDEACLQYASQKIPDAGRKKLYSSLHVKDLTTSRFQTWNLAGSWEVGEKDVVMYSRTTEEAEQCLRLLSGTVEEKRIPVRKDTMVLLDSDKWQIVNIQLEKKYPAQIATAVDHASNVVVCLATSAAVLEDVVDQTNLFLRDNQVRQMTLTYSEETLRRILKHKNSLDKLSASYSQFLVQVERQSETTVCVKGIGIGFGEALRHIHRLARKCASDEDRFDSDVEEEDDDDDEDTRFEEDNENAGQLKETVNVEMTMGDIGVAGVCLPGDHRMLYAVLGDMTRMEVDAIVNAADPRLKHDGGLAKEIVRKGGSAIQDECKLRVSLHGLLQVGDVFSSSAGNLPARVIIHAVGPKWKNGNSGELDYLRKTVYNSLQSAAGQRLSSVAIPAVGAGSYGMPVAKACDVIVSTVRDFLTEKPRCSIREIYFCDITAATAQIFVGAIQRCFDKSDLVVCSLNKPSAPRHAGGNERLERTAEQQGTSRPCLLMM